MPFVEDAQIRKIVSALIKVIAEYRQAQGLTYEDLAEKAGIHRTTIGLLERNERSPTVQIALQLASALGVELSEMLARAEAVASGKSPQDLHGAKERAVQRRHFHNEPVLTRLTGLGHDCIRSAIQRCYQTLDKVDFQLTTHNTPPLAKLVELANISSMIGNLLAGQIAAFSNGLYVRNRPHAYPDLLPVPPHNLNVEIKIALDTNMAKGHLPKPGTYMTFRYVLCDKNGKYTRGKENRGDTAFVWEARVGALTEQDFAVSNTEGDSGKTAVIKTDAFNSMTMFYFVPDLLPYSAKRAAKYPNTAPNLL